jgi:hypothetical protein
MRRVRTRERESTVRVACAASNVLLDVIKGALQTVTLKLCHHFLHRTLGICGNLLSITRHKGCLVIVKTELDESLDTGKLWCDESHCVILAFLQSLYQVAWKKSRINFKIFAASLERDSFGMRSPTMVCYLLAHIFGTVVGHSTHSIGRIKNRATGVLCWSLVGGWLVNLTGINRAKGLGSEAALGNKGVNTPLMPNLDNLNKLASFLNLQNLTIQRRETVAHIGINHGLASIEPRNELRRGLVDGRHCFVPLPFRCFDTIMVCQKSQTILFFIVFAAKLERFKYALPTVKSLDLRHNPIDNRGLSIPLVGQRIVRTLKIHSAVCRDRAKTGSKNPNPLTSSNRSLEILLRLEVLSGVHLLSLPFLQSLYQVA